MPADGGYDIQHLVLPDHLGGIVLILRARACDSHADAERIGLDISGINLGRDCGVLNEEIYTFDVVDPFLDAFPAD